MNYLTPKKSLNKAFLKIKLSRQEINNFKDNLCNLLEQTKVKIDESEEFHKNNLATFLRNTYYHENHYLNTQDKNDLVIHIDKNVSSNVGVILEIKSPKNKNEMPTSKTINTKACQQLVFYYLQERIINKNLELKYLIATNIYEWFIFDAQIFDKYFAQNKDLVKRFTDFETGRLSIKTTDLFYKEIAQPAIAIIEDKLVFTYFDFRDYLPFFEDYKPQRTQRTQREEKKEERDIEGNEDRELITLFKLLSPFHLLKLPFVNDSNSLDKDFYNELLHIMGLTEVKEGGKKLIQRLNKSNNHQASFLENAINQIEISEKIEKNKSYEEELFNVSLELVITWLNRILFLKLLEAQLINYHRGDTSFSFLNLQKIPNYNVLNNLFFRILASPLHQRKEEDNKLFANIPYLNSSLFEITETEKNFIAINSLQNELELPIFATTVLKDNNGNKRIGKLNALQYLFEFLDAYDFGNTPQPPFLRGKQGEIFDDNKKLINASVLGLIFEKINGYKDGSFFTPSFITMYMCQETIRRAVVQKFNEIKSWNCENIDDLYNKIDDKKEANNIINSLKICDPAVGSGHFLVSALNEIIAIKSYLKILLDRQGKTLRDYQIEVIDDELIVTDDDGELFQYNPKNLESQRVQETLFHEKQTIIENCLFGVDINLNSVKICRLRLWIELLKNAYYLPSPLTPLPVGEGKFLQTLPNIDINIKCGNSLISRFQLNTDLRQALKKSKLTIDVYKNAVKIYHNPKDKQEKREMENLISQIKANFTTTMNSVDFRLNKLRQAEGELNNLLNQISLFEESKTEKKVRESKQKKLEKEINLLTAEIEDMKSNRIYNHAFEWRFEFPEVLNDEGDFVGFDVVIGNPPYGVDLTKIQQSFFNTNYEFGTSETAILFIKKGWDILHKKGNQSYIIPKSYTFASNYGKIRNFTINNLTELVDCGKVWQDVKLEVCIFRLNKAEKSQFYYSNKLINTQIIKQTLIEKNLVNIFDFFLNGLTNEEINIGLKIIENCQTLNDISTNQRGAMIQKLLSENGDTNVIGGAEIQKYGIKGIKGKVYLKDINDQKAFIKPNSILVQRIVAHIEKPFNHIKITASIPDCNDYLLVDTINQITLNKSFFPELIWVILHSYLINWYVYRFIFSKAIRTMQFDNPTTSRIPIPKTINTNVQNIFQEQVTQIIAMKKANSNQDTSELEREIDLLVYELYGLTEEEIKIVEGETI